MGSLLSIWGCAANAGERLDFPRGADQTSPSCESGGVQHSDEHGQVVVEGHSRGREVRPPVFIESRFAWPCAAEPDEEIVEVFAVGAFAWGRRRKPERRRDSAMEVRNGHA